MKTILIQFQGHGQGKLFDPEARDSVTEPFIYLRERLRALGYRLETADDRPLDECAFVLFWDFHQSLEPPTLLRRAARAARRLLRPAGPAGRGAAGAPPRPLYAECVRAGLRDRTVLITGEPPVVLPANWDPKVHALFPTILTWNDRLVDNTRFHKFFWPVTAVAPRPPAVPFERKKLLVNISANKFSSHPQELYSARRETVRHFERSRPELFDLYGVGWDAPAAGAPRGSGDARAAGAAAEPAYPSYRGTVRHKWEIFPRYRFGLCYENMRDEPGFITEKIFDCMRADCVPVYWGASNVSELVDAEAFIDRRAFRSDADLERHLVGITVREYERYGEAIRAYLASDRFARFLSPAFAETIVRVLRV